MSFLFTIGLVTFIIHRTFRFWGRVNECVGPLPKISSWFYKGVVAPVIVWIFFNSGLSPAFPPLIPRVTIAKTMGRSITINSFSDVMRDGTWGIVVYWCLMTLIWQLFFIFPNVERRQFFIGTGFCSIVLLPFVIFIPLFHGVIGIAFAAMLWLFVISNIGLSAIAVRIESKPSYGTAITQMNMGRYGDAELEIVGQLEKREDDFEGWMMLAKLYATRDRDLLAAQRAILDLCNQSNLSAKEVSTALHRLAGWHLSIGDDPIAARTILGEICRRYPKTELELLARERMELMPRSKEEWLERKEEIPYSARHLL